MDQEEFLIHELAEKASVTVRTIRYYIDEGILPPPVYRGKYAYYNRDHLSRLEVIRQMKDAFLPLREIRQAMESLSDDEIRKHLEKAIERGSTNEPPPAPAPAPAPALADSKKPGSGALEYIARLTGRQSHFRSQSLRDVGAMFFEDSLIAQETGKTEQSKLEKGLPVEKDLAPGEIWQRIILAPGVEIHLREPVDPALKPVIQKFIDTIQVQKKQQLRGG